MELNVIGAKPLNVSDEVFGGEFKQALIHQVVVAYQAGGRAGTKAQLSRGELSGTTKKFKKQKGGGARHGDYRAPIFVGGGVTFAAKPRNFEQKVNRKAYRVALRSILAELNRQGRLKVVESFGIDTPKTKAMVAKLAELQVSGRVLLVSEDANEATFLAARNIPYIHVVDVLALNPVSLVGSDHIVMTVDAVKKIEEWLA
ncbi:large subunit ribosomal protein L4 [Dyella sp. SG562]|jgi:large subunit ribosomal protein L4|uniref:50S ribosomal protein L4 n=1 Tax=unclassified Dyella TaxID=2634549 RepID=UPI001423A5D4|nr:MULTISPECIES: 50S ribosomal protein L4 [unclassified Dyella]MBT2119740.1 50S ribosomal protein L4 [Dyella sp. LX-1]MBT2142167.1 50S ribosomal protein L4 [Dyella sp. LX-66]NII75560.1 large subunit ribosomal protein L4 [Dyella sp. SG562]NKJ23719.1 large subunit ribosomal protein L4 [Dyella sp. SG609]